MEQNKNSYGEVREVLDTRNRRKMIEDYERLMENSVKAKKIRARRNHLTEVVTNKIKKEKIKKVIESAALGILAVTVGLGGSFLVIERTMAPQREQVNGIKTVIQEINPEITDKQLDRASKDTYYVLNSEDDNAILDIYDAYRHGKENVDIVLETSYKILNNQDEYEFVPDEGYTVEVSVTNFNDYLEKIMGNFPEKEREQLYVEHVNRVRDYRIEQLYIENNWNGMGKKNG